MPMRLVATGASYSLRGSACHPPPALLCSACFKSHHGSSGSANHLGFALIAGGVMVARRLVYTAAAVIAFVAMTLPAAAQTTGTIVGTVKDAQGGIVPGASVTLTSDSRGTRLADVVTDSSGDF